MIPGITGLSENIEAIAIVDRFLEHSRVIVFCNGGNNQYYITSADWMIRNFDNRIEVACPVFDKSVQKELMKMLKIQLSDNVKARIIAKHMVNPYKVNDEPAIRSQLEIYNYFDMMLKP